jgi:nucleoside-diphosphate-sugar epimerase
MLSKKNILVTGGAGFIGSHVVERLLKDERYQVFVFDNFSSGKHANIPAKLPKGNIIEGDIRNIDEILSATKAMDYVVHLAALVSVQECINNPELGFEINVKGTRNVFESAKRNKVTQVVYASSAAVYGDEEELPKTEGSPLKPISPYGEHKLQNELDAKNYSNESLAITGLRFFNVFGERQDPSSPYSGVISIFINNFFSKRQIVVYGDGNQTRDFVYVGNIVNAIQSLLIESVPDKHGIYNVGTGRETSLNELLRILKDISKRDISIIYNSAREGDIIRSYSSISKLAEKVNYKIEYELVEGLGKIWDSLPTEIKDS